MNKRLVIGSQTDLKHFILVLTEIFPLHLMLLYEEFVLVVNVLVTFSVKLLQTKLILVQTQTI